MFNPRRLSLARKRRKLTAKRFAELLGMSPVTVTRLERANNEPEPATVAAISRVLEFPIAFFYGDDIDELSAETASFRSLSAMTAKEREAALAAGSFAYLLSDWVSARFNLPEPAVIDLSGQRDEDAAARTLRDHWGLGEQPISNMIKLLESKGVRVFSLAENTKNVDAFSCWRDGIPYIFLNTFKSAEHSRFDAAHELGHLVLHRHGGPHQGGRSAEIEANKFASCFLMPTDDLQARVRHVNTLEDIVRAKKRWGVSAAALAYRLHKMGLISDWNYRGFCIEMNRRNYRTKEPDGLEPELSVVWQKVLGELWSERTTKDHIAAELSLPAGDVDNLIFGLTGSVEPIVRGKPSLRLVS
jgi:Zn-dependent peptidase ImmA (M78 family)/DNA-binding XRE family transcriptional regulator